MILTPPSLYKACPLSWSRLSSICLLDRCSLIHRGAVPNSLLWEVLSDGCGCFLLRLLWALAHTGALASCVFIICEQDLSPTLDHPALPDGMTLTHSVSYLSRGQRKSAGARCLVFIKGGWNVRRTTGDYTHVSTYHAHPPYRCQ